MRRAACSAAGGLILATSLLLTSPSRITVPVGDDARLAAPARVTGVHGREVHSGRVLRWTDGLARVAWPSVFGVRPVAVDIVLAAFPGRAGDQVTITVNDAHVSRHVMSGDWDVIRVLIPSGRGEVTLDIRSLTHHGPGDPRDLGVRLSEVTLYNGDLGTVLSHVRWWQFLVLAAAAALAVGAGRWMAPGIGGIAGLAAFGLMIWYGRPQSLQLETFYALGGALAVGAVIFGMLRRAGVERRSACAVGLGTGAPFFILTLLALQHFVDVPRWDIWEFVTLVEKYKGGTLTPGDLWAPHNTHRPMTGRALLLANVVLTRWNHWFDLGMVLTAAALQLVVVALFVARTQGRETRVHPASLVVVALFLFSLMQWENWLQGWQVLLLVGALSVIAALLVLCDGRSTWSRLCLAAGLGFLGTASFQSCLLVWPLGALAIVARRDQAWRSRLAVWLIISTVVVLLYAWGLPSGASAHSDLMLTWQGRKRLVSGVFVSLGTPVFYRPGVFMGPAGVLEWTVVAAGVVAVAVATLAGWRRWRDDETRESTWLFPALLCLFGIGAGTMAALGRVGLSVQPMTASRYVVFGSCFWTGLILLLAMRGPLDARATRWSSASLLLIAALLAADNWRHPLTHMEAHYLSSSQARAWLLRDDIHSAASVLYPDPFLLDRRRDVLRKHGLSLYRPGAR